MPVTEILATNLLSPVEQIRDSGARGFTMTDVIGEGSRGIHANEWEVPSVKIETLVPPIVAEQIVEATSRYFEHHAVIVYTSTVRVMRRQKFQSGDLRAEIPSGPAPVGIANRPPREIRRLKSDPRSRALVELVRLFFVVRVGAPQGEILIE